MGIELSIEDFTEKTGMIEDYDEVHNIVMNSKLDGLTKMQLIDDLDYAGHFMAYGESLEALKKLVDLHPEYHIVTTTDGENGEVVFENYIMTIDRINYYLAKGERHPYYAVESW